MEKLGVFLNRIKELNFWQRIFSWKSIRTLSYDAYDEFKTISQQLTDQGNLAERSRNEITRLQTENDNLLHNNREAEKLALKKDAQIDNLNSHVSGLNQKVGELERKISKYESVESERIREHHSSIASINQAKEDYNSRRKQLEDDRVNEREEVFNSMKKQWSDHQDDVEKTIKIICQNRLIEYVDNVPFKGKPDNTVKICGEFIVFDSKSPANDDLTNFPKYIKTQAENISKYTNQESVKKDIFMVVPTNTIHTISQRIFNMGEYNVFVITKDSLEPILLSLKKIEEYEFAEQLSPEDRDQICKILGKFVHTTKRKIQLDQFMNGEFLDLLKKCDSNIPEEMLSAISEYEKAEKLNPPTEKRTKEILTKELERRKELLNSESILRGVEIPDRLEELIESS